ncbi:N-acetylmuramoyl-L-alanine amidase [Amorphoplanes digitatis]|uniref:Peptidoglycan recognition protein family domain-containing protein n=1 Tax=Actinoplanes digitatis TaxID=1868 RepID=A0A7W7HUD5_9ACTN|nr:peptidoglycan recognition protein [Actinoplanes digitatis]MBB4760904.1 hypothetical protein [Actinoplanes digitatis]GID95096.1 hypothetical protein Adi01nite_45080 [Actinoplanes digitatis]
MLGTAVALSGAATVAASGGGAAPAMVAAGRAPAGPTLETIELVSGRAAAAAGAVPRRTTRPFSLVGATWTDPRAALAGAVEVRTRRAADGTWTGWQPLEADGVSPAEPGSRGGTDPLWVGDSDGIEARVVAGPGRAGAPAGLRLDLIDPGDPPPAAAPPAAPPQGTARVAVQPRPAPRLVSRARWGADESIVRAVPEYSTDVQVLFVHHTAGTNGYRCSESAAIIRGIQAYHVKSKHWDDIGYNFLVDRCGTLFEGRGGGVARAVVGAHTLGFNSRSSAIAVLGDYSGRSVTAKVKRVIAQVAAYKIGAYGNTPAGRVALISGGSDRYRKGSRATLNRIAGHRDTGKTECPGSSLYAQLGSIRSIAAAGPRNLALSKLNGATRVGRTWYTRGVIRPFWRVATPTSLLYRFDLLVDDALAASSPSGHRSDPLRIPAGRHKLRIRAVALNGRTANATVTIVSDRTLPRFTGGPSVLLRTGSLNGVVPVRVRWAAADVGGLRRVTLSGPATVGLGGGVRTWAGAVRAGVPTTYGLRATDRAGNARSVTVARTAVLVAESRAARTGAWRTLGGRAYLGGGALRSTAANASLSWSFTGRSASLAVSRTAASGRVQVYVDGRPAGMIDLRSPRTLNRRAVWTRAWNDSTRHTVRIRVEGTAGRPGVIADGLVYLR